MSGLDAIPVGIERPKMGGSTGNARPVLVEVSALAQRLARTGEAGAIDVQALPLSPADLDWLRDTLGRGEVSVTIDAAGTSSIDETAFPGVWWVTHRNEPGQVVAELIEVATVPDIVKAAQNEVAASAARLAAIAGESGSSTKERPA